MQWPRMSVWGLSTARSIRRVISGSSIRSLECTLATTTSSRARSVLVLVEGPVLQDVDLDAGQDAEGGQLVVEFGHDVQLLAQALGVESVGHGQAGTVVGQGPVAVAEAAGGLGHLADGRCPRPTSRSGCDSHPAAGRTARRRRGSSPRVPPPRAARGRPGVAPPAASMMTWALVLPTPGIFWRPAGVHGRQLVDRQVGDGRGGRCGRPAPCRTRHRPARAGRRCGGGPRSGPPARPSWPGSGPPGAARRVAWGTPAARAHRAGRGSGRAAARSNRGWSDWGASAMADQGSPALGAAGRERSGWSALRGPRSRPRPSASGVETWPPTRGRANHAPKTVLWGAFWLKSTKIRSPRSSFHQLAVIRSGMPALELPGQGHGSRRGPRSCPTAARGGRRRAGPGCRWSSGTR